MILGQREYVSVIVDEAHHFLSFFLDVVVFYASRHANSVAHRIAKYGLPFFGCCWL